MPRPTPSFPAFDEWQQMSESEQDALLDRLETSKRRRARITRLLVGVCVAALAALHRRGAVWCLGSDRRYQASAGMAATGANGRCANSSARTAAFRPSGRKIGLAMNTDLKPASWAPAQVGLDAVADAEDLVVARPARPLRRAIRASVRS